MIVNKNRITRDCKQAGRSVSLTNGRQRPSGGNEPGAASADKIATPQTAKPTQGYVRFCDAEKGCGGGNGKPGEFLDATSALKLSPNRRNSYGSISNNFDDYSVEPSECPTVADIIGNFGWFQFFVLVFSGLREAAVGYDAVIMSILLRPETNFQCADNVVSSDINFSGPNSTSHDNGTFDAQCFNRQTSDIDAGHLVRCESWLFPQSSYGGKSLVADWSLVCHRHWLAALIESAFFLGLVSGNLVWGFYADKLGRRRAYLIAHTVALFAGWAAVFMPSVESFAVCRFFSAFGLIGYNIIYSIQIELIGTKYRAFSTSMNHLGWGLGVICIPLANQLFTHYRYLIAAAPLLTLFMYPFAFLLPESSRWLMANGEYEEAKRELCRAAKFNGKKLGHRLAKQISLLKMRARKEKMAQCVTQATANAGDKSRCSSYKLLFRNATLVRDTLILSHVSFTGHLFYYLLTINFAYMKNLSIEANFITSGAGEWVSVLVGAALLRYCSRKTCMSIFLATMTASFILQATIDAALAPSLDTELVITTNNAVGTLSALLLIFVTLIVNQEVYPTVIRQTGSSIVNTLGETGSTLAPMLLYLATNIGLWRADMIYAFACTAAIVSVQFLTKTDDIELSDT